MVEFDQKLSISIKFDDFRYKFEKFEFKIEDFESKSSRRKIGQVNLDQKCRLKVDSNTI